MKNKMFTSILILLLLTLTACTTAPSASSAEPATPLPAPSPSAIPTQETFSDPFAYCATVGQIDAPDARYTGPQMSDALFKDYLKAAGLDPATNYPPEFRKMTIWRCMDKKVYACNFGANIPCDSKANTNKTPTQAIIDFCKENQNADFIPMSVTGHNVIYSWHCAKGVPEILNQIDTVDAAGYQSSFWQVLEPVFH
jgi:hypothetical protein